MSERFLRDVLEGASATPPASLPQTVRLSDVHRRISRTRRRRALAATATAAAAILAIAGGTAVLRDSATPPPPAATVTPSPSPTPKTFAGVPEYVDGARVFAAARADFPSATVKLQFTPPSDKITLVVRCSEPDIMSMIDIADLSMHVGCGESATYTTLKGLGLKVGKSNTITLNAQGVMSRIDHSWRDLPKTGHITLAVGTPVAFEDFPLPPRPATLPALPGPPPKSKLLTTIRSVPGDPNAPVTVKVPWKPHQDYFVHLQTPGAVRVSFNGKVFMTCRKWDYEPRSADPRVNSYSDGCGEERVLGDSNKSGGPGDLVTVKAAPEHVTGDWEIIITWRTEA